MALTGAGKIMTNKLAFRNDILILKRYIFLNRVKFIEIMVTFISSIFIRYG